MERLTIEHCDDYVPKELCSIDESGEADDCMLCGEYCEAIHSCEECAIDQCFRKLAQYENLEEQGLLLKLPCKVGDVVYVIIDSSVKMIAISCKVKEIKIASYGIEINLISEHEMIGYFEWHNIREIGKTVFLTREEAEEALKRIKSGGKD